MHETIKRTIKAVELVKYPLVVATRVQELLELKVVTNVTFYIVPLQIYKHGDGLNYATLAGYFLM